MAYVIFITAKRNGFRRCGVAHSDKPTVWQEDDFTDEQWEALSKEPQLTITVEERDLDSTLEQRNESTSIVAPQEATNTLQASQPVLVQANAAPVGDAGHDLSGQAKPTVGEQLANVARPLSALQLAPSDSSWEDAHLEEQEREFTKAWEGAHQEEQTRQSAKAQVTKPAAKVSKPKAAKAEDGDK